MPHLCLSVPLFGHTQKPSNAKPSSLSIIVVSDNDNTLGSHPEKRSLQANDGANSYKSLLNDCALILRAVTFRGLKMLPNSIVLMLSQWSSPSQSQLFSPLKISSLNSDQANNDVLEIIGPTNMEESETPIYVLLARFLTNQDLIRLALTMCATVYIRAIV